MSSPAVNIIDAIELQESNSEVLVRPLIYKKRVLLVKPYQVIQANSHSPPLGLLYIAANLREALGEFVHIDLVDMKIECILPEDIDKLIHKYQPDIIGMSALSFEAYASHNLAKKVKETHPHIITVIGGPYALKNSASILEDNNIDWVFEGPADRSFPQAIRILAEGGSVEDAGILGLSYRRQNGDVEITIKQDHIDDLDSLPYPAWDLINFDLYSHANNMAVNLRGKRYALLFTSRGCPYLCNYCHDIFTKKYVYHSVEYVINEIERLYTQYGVDEFQIVDDIFNLHKPRLKAIMGEVKRRWPGKLKFTFPNGVRADILDREVIDALVDAGTYLVCVAVETVTPRLQKLVEKNLNIEKTKQAIDYLHERDVQITGFFMLGFPTETPEEIRATIDFAVKSDMTLAFFFTVIPQYGTPIFDLACNENEEVTKRLNKVKTGTYRNSLPWYQQTYGFDLPKEIRKANIRFYLSPKRMLKVYKHFSFKWMLRNVKEFLSVLKL